MLPGAVRSPRLRLVEQGPRDGGFRLILGVSVAPRSCAVGEESACCLLRGHGVPFLSAPADLLNGRAWWGQASPETSVEPSSLACVVHTHLSPLPCPSVPSLPTSIHLACQFPPHQSDVRAPSTSKAGNWGSRNLFVFTQTKASPPPTPSQHTITTFQDG